MEQLTLFDDEPTRSRISYRLAIWLGLMVGICAFSFSTFFLTGFAASEKPKSRWEEYKEEHRNELAKELAEKDKKLREKVEEKNVYLQNPQVHLGQAKRTLEDLRAKLRRGELPLPPRGEVLREGHKAEERLTILADAEIIPAPPYLEQLFELAVSNHPAADETKKAAFNFKLLVCRNLESDCFSSRAYAQGTILISLEALALSENEAEFVGLLGHEIAHVLNEDQRRGHAFSEELEKLEYNEFAKKRAVMVLPDMELEEQIRADLDAGATLKNAGYDPCAFTLWGERFGLEKERIAAMRRTSSCGGSLWKIKNADEFASFKREFVRIDPDFRSSWELRYEKILRDLYK